MSHINQFKCDSCSLHVNAKYNCEHYLPPPNWVVVTDVNTLKDCFHLCPVCREVAICMDLSATKVGKRLEKNFK